jgi:hypothetical protein
MQLSPPPPRRVDSAAPDAPRGTVLAAALALPGIAAAQGAPTEGLVAFKFLHYQDQQPGFRRVSVSSPSLYALVPLGPAWSVEGAFVVDAVSGATPRYHSSVSSASDMSDTRAAADLKLTRHFRRAAVGLGLAYSGEHDFKSSAGSIDLRLSSDDNNTTLALGAGYTSDRIDSTGGAVAGESRRTADLLLGLTQVLGVSDIARFNLTHARGRGYYSDPYKLLDVRPRERDQTALLLQWNHHFGGVDGTLRSSYRYYGDSFGIRAHTFGFEYAQALGAGWLVTPAVRYYTQSAADFYFDPDYDPVLGPPFPRGYLTTRPAYTSADQRLSAYGGVTAGLRIDRRFGAWSVDLRYDYYEQRGQWRLGGQGSPGLEPFSAHMIQFGVSRRF